MRRAFNALSIDGTIVIGEGERDEAPMLYIGEKVGAGGPKWISPGSSGRDHDLRQWRSQRFGRYRHG